MGADLPAAAPSPRVGRGRFLLCQRARCRSIFRRGGRALSPVGGRGGYRAGWAAEELFPVLCLAGTCRRRQTEMAHRRSIFLSRRRAHSPICRKAGRPTGWGRTTERPSFPPLSGGAFPIATGDRGRRTAARFFTAAASTVPPTEGKRPPCRRPAARWAKGGRLACLAANSSSRRAHAGLSREKRGSPPVSSPRH